MTQVYFHCSNTKKVFVDYCGAVVDDLAEARDHATRVVESLTCERNLDDWRDWVLHVSDDRGDELFIVPFNPTEDAIEAAAHIANATLVRVAGHAGQAVAADSSPQIADVRRAIGEFLVRCIGQT